MDREQELRYNLRPLLAVRDERELIGYAASFVEPCEGMVICERRIVTTRTKHFCHGTLPGESHDITSGSRALVTTAIFDGEGRKKQYVCLECLEIHARWIDYHENYNEACMEPSLKRGDYRRE